MTVAVVDSANASVVVGVASGAILPLTRTVAVSGTADDEGELQVSLKYVITYVAIPSSPSELEQPIRCSSRALTYSLN